MPNFPRPSLGAIAAAIVPSTNPFGPKGGLQIQIDPNHLFVQGTLLYAKDIDRLGMSFTSFKEPLNDSLRKVVIPSIKMNFMAQGRPAWPKLKKSTVQDRLRKGFPRGPILQRTRRLYKMSIRKNIWEVRPARGSAGSDVLRLRVNYFKQLVPYAEYMQAGARYVNVPTGTIRHVMDFESGMGFTMRSPEGEERRVLSIPPRPYIQLTPEEVVEIYGIFMSFMTDKVNKYWGHGTAGL